ncbi:MAG: LCP family protein [Acidimicrobiia bacterium]|nr:LCP family protein [Acidimicrobiia bacterium]
MRRILIMVLVGANIVVFGAYFFLRNLESAFEDAVAINEEVVDELSATPGAATDPSTFLLIGSDSRENIPDDFDDFFGVAPGQRADVIMLLQVLPDEGRAQILSIPRDLKVELDGYGIQKINAAYAFGGGSLLVSSVREATGLPIHHYVEVDFAGFAAIVDEVGGVSINFPNPARDGKSGLSVPAGLQHLDGEEALAYARSRSYQESQDGQWVSVDATDIGRMGRQQELIFAILSSIKRPSTITQAEDLIVAVGEHLEVDAALVRRGFLDLAWAMRDIRPGSIDTFTYPTVTEVIDELYYEVPDEPAAGELLASFGSGESSDDVFASAIHVEILNGNGTKGIAGTYADSLEQEGFVVESVADAGNFDYPVTRLTAAPTDVRMAQLVADVLGFGTVVAGPVPSGIDVLVVLGADASSS